MLVRDPVPTLLYSLVPLTVVQMAYVVTCLPVAGEGSGKIGAGKVGGGKKGKKASAGHGGGSGDVVTKVAMRVIPAIISLLLTQLTIPLLLIIQILFGAPLTTHLQHTTLSSTHFALLAFYPLIYANGFKNWGKWRSILSLDMGWQGSDELIGGAVGVFVGAWLGAVPIPLDWDREWQRWPVTVVTGAYGGYVVGKFVGGWR